MRIIHINDKLAVTGGVEVYISQVQELLKHSGIDSDWIAIQKDGKIAKATSVNPSLNWIGTLNEFSTKFLSQLAVRGEIVFHVHSLSEPKILDALFDVAPVVRTIHEPRIFCPGQGKFWAKSEEACTVPFGIHCLKHAYTKNCCNRHPKRLLKQFLNTRYEVEVANHRYAALLANSSYTLKGALEVGFPEEVVHLLNYPTKITPKPNYEETSERRIVFSGRLSRTKGLHYLLDAFVLVVRQDDKVHLDIVGAGHDEITFRSQAEASGIASRVTFHGWVDQKTVGKHIDRANLVVFPSIYPEAFGLSGIEAMMRGKPVVGFDIGGVKDWLKNNETGLLVAPKNTQAFANAIIKILHDDNLRAEMGQRARKVALTKFSEKRHLQKLVSIYKKVLKTD